MYTVYTKYKMYALGYYECMVYFKFMSRKLDCKHCYYLSNSNVEFITSRGKKSDTYNVFLHKDQSYFGRCLVATKQHVGGLRDLGYREKEDFFTVVKDLEIMLVSVFQELDLLPHPWSEKDLYFNWTCFMNNAYQQDVPDPHVHWHVRPRYRQPFCFRGMEFTDPDFGKHYDITRKTEIPFDLQKEIIDKIRQGYLNWDE